MGESVVNAPDVQNKMGGSVSPKGALEVSISFGRFENDSLSWEKWSTFSPNKYLEEVEKCSTPGSVAQKKAYFEAHYKKIAAKKAELLEQEKMMRTDSSRSNELNCTDCSTSTSGTDAEPERGILNGQSFSEEVELETNSLSEVSSSLVNEPADVDRNGNSFECQNTPVETVGEKINGKLQFEEVNYPGKADLITEEISKISEGHHDTDEKPLKIIDETISMVKGQEENSESYAHNTDQKQTKEQNSALNMNKKSVLPTTKSTGLSTFTNPRLPMSMSTSTPRSSKPVSNATPRSSKPVSNSTPRSSKLVSTFTPRSSKPVSTSTPRSSKPVSTSTPILSKPLSTSTPRSSKALSTSTPRSSKLVPTSTPRSSKSVPASTLRPSKTGSAATSRLYKPLSTSSPALPKSVSTSAPRLTKPASASTSRLSKPASNPMVRPVSQSSTRKLNVSTGSKISSGAEIRQAAPTALNKSLDMVTFSPSRQSFIMEQMGDKDIVKRAFKSFQNNLNQLQPSHVENPCGSRPISARGSSEHQASSSVTSQKENERTRKATGKMNAQKNLTGTKWSTTSSRSLVETGAGIYLKPDSSSSSPISEERAEKRKAFLKNLKEKSYAREEEKRRLSSEPKEAVENNIGQQS
ncbi:flocculation protein FLO11 isoform X2 [Daucus carota subsp. sativus]|uniref:flocculation protein FLO11 isoform X2 n=1 Tax=Daucus carota subsp. sativus TaxID=79200 RepID=UPI0007EF089A|nr:PREDICTED: flocculation protein FLO11 isoform X2 [Daucus carota subsp. sativus]